MKKDIIISCKVDKQQKEYLDEFMYNHKLETNSQTLRALINHCMITNPLKVGVENAR